MRGFCVVFAALVRLRGVGVRVLDAAAAAAVLGCVRLAAGRAAGARLLRL
ncbi:hypothetical protein ABH923_003867 [Leifsonia sp. EB41]